MQAKVLGNCGRRKSRTSTGGGRNGGGKKRGRSPIYCALRSLRIQSLGLCNRVGRGDFRLGGERCGVAGATRRGRGATRAQQSYLDIGNAGAIAAGGSSRS